MKILAIESSCDETAAAVVEDGRRVLSNVVASQIEIHRRFGGVVPEIASRNHTLAIDNVVAEALEQADAGKDDIDAVAVTYGAGLLGALLVGVNYAKGLAYAWKKPLYAVSHVKGHLAANYIDSTLEPPYLCLLASGGHTALLSVKDYEATELIGQSRDDAAGEAFDKVARVLGLPYPGGPEIQRLAKQGRPVYKMPLPSFKNDSELRFSYSGLKTFVINLVHGMEQRGRRRRRRERQRTSARPFRRVGRTDGEGDILPAAEVLHRQRGDDRRRGVLPRPLRRGERGSGSRRQGDRAAVICRRARNMRAVCAQNAYERVH